MRRGWSSDDNRVYRFVDLRRLYIQMHQKVVTLIDTLYIGFLVEQVRRGNQQAFETLHDMFHRSVYKAAQYRVGEEHAADVTQETFYRAYRYLRTLRNSEQFGPWLMRIARNVSRDWLRERGRIQDNEKFDVDELAHVLVELEWAKQDDAENPVWRLLTPLALTEHSASKLALGCRALCDIIRGQLQRAQAIPTWRVTEESELEGAYEGIVVISEGQQFTLNGTVKGKVVIKDNAVFVCNGFLNGDVEKSPLGTAIVHGKIRGNIHTTEPQILKAEEDAGE